MRAEIVLSGFGGQGIILAGFILGQAAAIYEGRSATFTQDYGPEARGGSCRAQVVISDGAISYPYVESPSALVFMSQDAYSKYCRGLKPDAVVIVDSELVKPEKIANPLYAIPSVSIARELGRSAIANIVMLGFFTAVTSFVSADAMKKSITDAVPKGTEQLNLRAFERGYSYNLAGEKL